MATAKIYYYDKRYLSFMRAETTQMANRDPSPRKRPAPSGDPFAVAGPSTKTIESDSSSEEDRVQFEPPLLSEEDKGADAEVETAPYVAHGQPAGNETTPAVVQPEREPSPGTKESSGPSSPSSETERKAMEATGKKAFSFKIFPTDGPFFHSSTLFLFFVLQMSCIKK
jgi:hypothetical protein